MTISAETAVAGPYNGDGSTTAFTFAFKCFSTSEIDIYVESSAGAQALQTLTTHYSVSLNSDQDASPGGTVTMVTAPASGAKLHIVSGAPYTRTDTFSNSGGFYPNVLNDARDKTTLQIQQIKDMLSRAVIGPVGESVDQIPNAANRASKYLGFDSTGKPVALDLQSSGTLALGTGWSAALAEGFVGTDKSLATKAELKAVTSPDGNQLFNVAGRTSAGDGGGGAFVFLSGDQSLLVKDAAKAATAIDTGTDLITIVGYDWGPGEIVEVTTAGAGLTVGQRYFVGQSYPGGNTIDADDFCLFASWAHFMAGTPRVGLTSATGLELARVLDPEEGHIITPDSDATGASGAYKRLDSSALLDPRHFGAVMSTNYDTAARTTDYRAAWQGAMDYAKYTDRAGVFFPPGYSAFPQMVVRKGKARVGASNGGFGVNDDDHDISVVLQHTDGYGDDMFVYEPYSDGSSVLRCGAIYAKDYTFVGPTGSQSAGHGDIWRRPIQSGETRASSDARLIAIVDVKYDGTFPRGFAEDGINLGSGVAAPCLIENFDPLFNGGYGVHLESLDSAVGITINNIYGDGNKGGAAVRVAISSSNATVNLNHCGGETRTNAFGNTAGFSVAQPYGISIGSVGPGGVINIVGGACIETSNGEAKAFVHVNATSVETLPVINIIGGKCNIPSSSANTFSKYLLFDELTNTHVPCEQTNAINWPNSEKGSGVKNYLHNGGFWIKQRGTTTGISTTSGTINGLDRWGARRVGGGGTLNISQEDFTTPSGIPTEPQHYMRVDTTNLTSSAGFAVLATAASSEGEMRELNEKMMTWSFWAKASAAITVTPTIFLVYGGGGSSTDTLTTVEGDLDITTSWAEYTVTFQMSDMTSKTFGTDPHLQPNLVDSSVTAGTTFDIAEAQLEMGHKTTFETLSERGGLQAELARCQEYYWTGAVGVNGTGTYSNMRINMREVPTISGGGSGFSSTGTTKVNLICSQTTAAAPTLTLDAEVL